MDYDALSSDLKLALSGLPPEILTMLTTIATKYHNVLGAQLPVMLELLKPHLGAVMLEYSCGMIDVPTLEATIMEAIKSLGLQSAA